MPLHDPQLTIRKSSAAGRILYSGIGPGIGRHWAHGMKIHEASLTKKTHGWLTFFRDFRQENGETLLYLNKLIANWFKSASTAPEKASGKALEKAMWRAKPIFGIRNKQALHRNPNQKADAALCHP